MTSSNERRDTMAIGRQKTNTKVLGFVFLLITLLTLRMFWEAVRSAPRKPADGPSYYPVDEYDTIDVDSYVNVVFEVLKEGVSTKDPPSVLHIPNQTLKESVSTPSGLVTENNNNSRAKPADSAGSHKVMKEIKDNSDNVVIIEQTPSTKSTSAPIVSTKVESEHNQKEITDNTHNTYNTTLNIKRMSSTKPTIVLNIGPTDIQQIPIKSTKETNKPNKMIVTENSENLVVFTKEQLNYGKFVDAEETKLRSASSSSIKENNATTPKVYDSTINQSPEIDNQQFKPKSHIKEINEPSKDNTDVAKIGTGNDSTRKSTENSPLIKATKVSLQENGEIGDKPVENIPRKSTEDTVLHSAFKHVPLSEAKSYGQCQKAIPWGQTYHAKISTFNLPKKGNYSVIDGMGNYPIPVKTVEEVTDPKTLEPVTVILVPFSHADPGYGLTIEQYYATKTHHTLDNMIQKLQKYPHLTFQWAETVFLARWFKDLTEDKKIQVRQLIENGQLEIVLGGWVMPDEASSRYVGVVDQLIEGHQWLIENLGVKPKTAWVNDPFGYSSTMPYLWKSSGMDNLLFLRINQAVKAQLMKMGSMDFKWRPYWKTDNSSDVLASLMAYTNYWIGDVCSPDRDTCNEFGFIHLDEMDHRAIAINDANLEKQAEKLHGMFRVTANLYKYNTLYIGLGEDFTFVRAAEWDNLYTNYEKLINYINSKSEWKMNIKFGNVSEYFSHVKKVAQEKINQSGSSKSDSPDLFPTVSGDFYPYTEKNEEYWTGYYTTRPLNKRFSRELETLIHTTDLFNVMMYSIFRYYNMKQEGYEIIAENLRIARRELGMFLHHDGITGTSLPHVVRDFEWRLLKAHVSIQKALKTVLVTMLTKGSSHSATILQEETVKPGPRKMSKKIVLQVVGDQNKLILVNSVGRRRKEVVSVYVNRRNVKIVSPKMPSVPYQITSVEDNKRVLVSFLVDLPAYGIEVFKVVPLDVEEMDMTVQQRNLEDIQVGAEAIVTIENAYIKAQFNQSTGMVQHIVDKKSGETTYITSDFLLYRSSRSGAYIFGPAGPATAFTTGKRTVVVTKGHLMSEVKVQYPGFMISAVLYNTSGIQGQGLHIRTEVDMKSVVGMKDMEVILRFSTSIKNGPNFFTDQNGYQLMGRQTDRESKIESNYYPITTMAILEDKHKRLTLHSKQPHGAASLSEGELEIMLDRHTFRDDGRGLGQGVYDNVNVNSDFVLQIEYKTVPSDLAEVRYAYPTQDAVLLNDALQNNVFIYSVVDNNVKISDKIHPIKEREIPCDITIVGLRNLVKNNLNYNGTSLVLHRHSFQCGYQSQDNECLKMDDKFTVKGLIPKLKVKVTETSLSHLHVHKVIDMYTDLKPQHMELRSFIIDI